MEHKIHFSRVKKQITSNLNNIILVDLGGDLCHVEY
jgi:hypothetical protein